MILDICFHPTSLCLLTNKRKETQMKSNSELMSHDLHSRDPKKRQQLVSFLLTRYALLFIKKKTRKEIHLLCSHPSFCNPLPLKEPGSIFFNLLTLAIFYDVCNIEPVIRATIHPHYKI